MKRVAGLVFHAPLGATVGEELVQAARAASTRGLCTGLRDCGVDPVLVVSSEDVAERDFPDIDLWPVPASDGETFHFGRVLRRIIAEFDIGGLLYFGSGSGGLLSPEEMSRLVRFVHEESGPVVFNNFYSCDFAAITEAKHLLDIELPSSDNPLGFTLADAGIPCMSMPRSVSTQFDIDTPTDIHLVARTERGHRELRRFVTSRSWPHPTIDRALDVLTDRTASTLLIGRVNPTTWSHIEREVACRTAAFVEGRGMRASSSRHVPWLRQTLLEDGVRRFFDRLEGAADAAWIDTRPLLATSAGLPSPSIRFASDLFRVDEVTDPLWRDFTEGALNAHIPIVLGGHTVVSGGLYLAAEACWKGLNLPRRLHPEPFGSEKERP